MPNTRPPAIPQGLESKRYVSHTQPNPPPTISAASRSVAILTAWPSPAYNGSCEGGMSYPQRRVQCAHTAMTLPMAGGQFKQNHPKFVKPTMHCDAASTVGYSEWRVGVDQYTFTHDSFLPTIVPWWASTALGPHDGRPREDAL
jgi:hypothetical protein